MTTIPYVTKTWEPVSGCTPVSEGCKNCWARTLVEGRLKRFYPEGFGAVRTHPERLEDPLHWRKPQRVFVCSRADLFHEEVSDEFLERAFIIMARAPQQTFLILTKRPERMGVFLSNPGTKNFIVNRAMAENTEGQRKRGWEGPMPFDYPIWPLPNCWLGISVENQRAAEERIPLLLQTPAAVRFVSAEPLLGRLSLLPNHCTCACGCRTVGFLDRKLWFCASCFINWCHGQRCAPRKLDWVIAGGESGPGARPAEIEWFHDLREQCRATGVPFYMKQDSGRYPGRQGRIPDELWSVKELPA